MTPDQRFARCLAEILKDEGGYVNRASDPGGPTNHGITLKTLREVYGSNQTINDLKAITPNEVSAIYRKNYWGSICDNLPAGLDLMYFNAAVNNGPGHAHTFLSAAMVHTTPVHQQIINFSDIQTRFYRGLKGYAEYGRGWMNREKEITNLALSWSLDEPSA